MHTDIPLYRKKRSFFQYIPGFFWPYILLARWDRPVGIFLLAVPCWWGLAIAGAGLEKIGTYSLFFIGAILMRGAGCTYNDYLDVRYDVLVERTKQRPLAAKTLTKRKALVFLMVQLMLAAAVLFSLTGQTILLGIGALGLVALYPLMKRWTYWPQLFLGLTFNWGVLMGASEIAGTISLSAFCLYGVGILWTLCYDTIYAYQDREDDLKIGVKSLALKLGDRPKAFILACLGGMALLLAGVGMMRQANLYYYALAAAPIFYYVYLTARIDLQEMEECLQYFKRAVWVEFLFLAAIFLTFIKDIGI